MNNPLQEEYFRPGELSSVAHQLDETQWEMAEGEILVKIITHFCSSLLEIWTTELFFSIQVISNALKVWGLELILFSSPECQKLWINPQNER